ncbi:MAG: HD domain-containing protein [Patescibacteria group bacterium]
MSSLLVKKALYFAAQKHEKQYRKGIPVPYIVHPVQVAFGVSKYTSDEEVIASAFLHDTLEDCHDVSLDILKNEFGHRVASLVDEVSLDKDKKYTTWKEKKEAYLKKINKASKDALIIVAIDKMSNLEGYFGALIERGGKVVQDFGGTPNEYIWYYTEVGNILFSTLGESALIREYNALLEFYKKKTSDFI